MDLRIIQAYSQCSFEDEWDHVRWSGKAPPWKVFLYSGRKLNHLFLSRLLFSPFITKNMGLWLTMRLNNWFQRTILSVCWQRKNSDQTLKPSEALPFSGKTSKWCTATQSHDWFPDKDWGGDLPAHSPLPSNTLIPLPNKKICRIFPPFFFFFSSSLCFLWATASMDMPSAPGETTPIERDLSLTR